MRLLVVADLQVLGGRAQPAVKVGFRNINAYVVGDWLS
jgi:hypothetical protein